MRTLWHDLRFALRMLQKTPGATLFALLALALGIGVNTSVFCVLSTALWRPLPIPDVDDVVSLVERAERTGTSDGPTSTVSAVSYRDYIDLRDQNQVFVGLAASELSSFAVSTAENRRGGGNERAENAFAEIVSGNYFDVLGVHAILGRTFSPEEDRTPGTHPVVVLSHSLWQRRFNADPNIVGRTIHVNTTAMTVIGVAPQAFHGLFSPVVMDFWFPMMMRTHLNDDTDEWMTDRSHRSLTVIGRLRPGLDVTQARANAKVVWQTLVQQYPTTNKGATVDVVPELQARYGAGYDNVRFASILAQLVAALVLLVSCANVANLLLAKASVRAKEIAIRQALGASRWRVVRQLLTESLLLALLGGALGLVVASWCGELFHATLPTVNFQVAYDFTPDARAFGGALAISLLTGILFGLTPALRTSRVAVVAALKTDVAAQGQSLRRFGLRHILVVTQVAISIVVVVSGALFVRSLRKIELVDPGLRVDSLYSVLLDPGQLDYTPEESREYFVNLVRRVETIPGVRSAALATFVPLTGVLNAGPVVREGDPPALPNRGMRVTYTAVGPKYFETAGTELVLGRDFLAEEHDEKPTTAIVNQEMARTLFGDARSALGKRFRAGTPDSALLEIVGVARDGKYKRLTEDAHPHLFLPEIPSDSVDAYRTGRVLLVHAASQADLAVVAEQVRREIQRLDARIPIQMPFLGGDHLTIALYLPRVAATVGVTLGLIALFLAMTGVYSVMAYGVSQRTKEIGIRMALGAQPADVVGLVVREGLVLLSIGLAVGSVGAFFAGRMAASFLYGIGATDPLAFGGTLLLLLLVAILATYLPARRATRVDPMIALRYE